jgi:GMC oxidoreductase
MGMVVPKPEQGILISSKRVVPMSCERADGQQRLLASLQKCAAVGQIDWRAFLGLAATIGIQSSFAEVLADETMAAPTVQGRGGRSIETSYDYIVVGAGSAGCTIAARLSQDPACRVLLIEAGGADISRLALQNPVLWPSNFGTDIDWAYRTTPQAQAAGRSSTGREARSSADPAASMAQSSALSASQKNLPSLHARSSDVFVHRRAGRPATSDGKSS